MLDNLSVQKRMIIATIVSVLFFITYDYFFIPNRPLDVNSTKVSAQNQAPQAQDKDIKSPEVAMSKTLLEIKGATYSASIDEFGRISRFVLEETKFKDENGKQISLLNPRFQPLPLEIRFSNSALNEKAFKTPYTASVASLDASEAIKSVILKQDLGDLVVEKTITFYPNGSYDLKITPSKNVDYFVTPGLRPSVAVDGYTIHGALVRKNDDSLDILEDGDAKGDEIYSNIDLLSDSDRYYTTLFFSKKRDLNVYIQNDAEKNTLAFVRTNGNIELKGYIGPKDNLTLKQIDPSLTDVVEYGWFTFISRPMFAFLSWIHSFTGNWGWAIVIMTLVVRIVLFPLTYKGMVSMNKLKDLAPKMKEIQTKYKGDAAKINAHVMELYKKNGANPMGGCLPILIQIPIFFAIYRVLLNAIEIKGEGWILWIHDLAIKDPWFILPILMGLTMFIQQKITPTNFTDPMQEKIMKWLPAIFTLFFITFPAGLTLYWFINNLCSLAQQAFVNKIFAKQKQAAILEKQQ